RNRMVVALLGEDRIAQALAAAEETERLAVDHLAETDVELAKAICNLAAVEGKAGDAKKALKTYGRALQALRAAVGERHVYYGRTLGNIAAFLAALGKDKEAESIFVDAMLTLANVPPEEQGQLARVLLDLTELHQRMSEREQAEVAARRQP